MIILGIDPGLATTGYGLIKKENQKFSLIDYGAILTSKKLTLPPRLNLIYKKLQSVIKKHKPNLIAVEKIFFCQNAKTAIDISQARGVILLTAALNNIAISELTPLQVKQTLTNYGRAGKNQIQTMIKLLLNLKEIPKPDDAADALAIAYTAGVYL